MAQLLSYTATDPAAVIVSAAVLDPVVVHSKLAVPVVAWHVQEEPSLLVQASDVVLLIAELSLLYLNEPDTVMAPQVPPPPNPGQTFGH